jgi:hypothetical protein
MASHSQLQQQQQQHQIPTQRQSPHHTLYQTGSSPDFDTLSPGNRASLQPTTSGSENTMQNTGMDDNSENSEWGLTKAGKKRQRLPLACQVCRKKKVRCHFRVMLMRRYGVLVNNLFVNIVYDFHYLVCIKRLLPGGLGIVCAREMVLLAETAEEILWEILSKIRVRVRHRLHREISVDEQVSLFNLFLQ